MSVRGIRMFGGNDLHGIYATFGENQGKRQTAKSTSATEEWTWHLPSTTFWPQPLVGLRAKFDIHALPGMVKYLWIFHTIYIQNKPWPEQFSDCVINSFHNAEQNNIQLYSRTIWALLKANDKTKNLCNKQTIKINIWKK